MTSPVNPRRRSSRRTVGDAPAFWVVAVTFLLVMAYSTVPTPLYPLYEQRDGFAPFVVTAIFAAYAIGVMVSLYLAGHVSDQLGRRRVLVVAVLVSALSAVLFLIFTDVPGLLVARFVNGASIGILTATATAHLGELRARAKPAENAVVAASVAGAANLGGLALGPLIGGLFAEFLPDPLMLPHLVFLVVLVVGAVALTLVPETVDVLPRSARQPYRPQRLSVPAGSGRAFAVAAFGAFSGFAVFGLFSSLAPTFLVVTFDSPDHLLAGATSFSVFAAAAIGQLALVGLRMRTQLTIALAGCTTGLVLVAAGALVPALGLFLVGGVAAGLGVGLLFKGALGTAIALAEPTRRGETLALVFLVAYAGLALPALGVGAALALVSPIVALVVFVALVLVATVVAGTLMRRRAPRP